MSNDKLNKEYINKTLENNRWYWIQTPYHNTFPAFYRNNQFSKIKDTHRNKIKIIDICEYNADSSKKPVVQLSKICRGDLDEEILNYIKVLGKPSQIFYSKSFHGRFEATIYF